MKKWRHSGLHFLLIDSKNIDKNGVMWKLNVHIPRLLSWKMCTLELILKVNDVKRVEFFCSFFLALCYLYWLRKNCIFKYFGRSRRLSKNTFAFRDFLKLIDCDLWQSRNRIPSKCLLHSGDQSYIFHSVNNHKLSKSKISCIYFSFKNYYSIKFVTTNVTFSCIVSQITWK